MDDLPSCNHSNWSETGLIIQTEAFHVKTIAEVKPERQQGWSDVTRSVAIAYSVEQVASLSILVRATETATR
ncbi:hypothetical protein CLDAP_24010 [Caldilinea aerophila DSM 14535 = NBRC 104270]|jgi:hypothetical protein|uniref:Uncharacterized protein n=1 Tax=Caldilinea aerophila (strain DSM 14535 / JCM 11387 / NBRC 104270 / STL-6-O1) TaxID=926550 RepID=I0I5A3_CALAS|nr:hypothetical protein CLDAP_24010 [Caldilinea aerophila DSM 14535 = NBRC 104270]